jgi:hypothetical protein
MNILMISNYVKNNFFVTLIHLVTRSLMKRNLLFRIMIVTRGCVCVYLETSALSRLRSRTSYAAHQRTIIIKIIKSTVGCSMNELHEGGDMSYDDKDTKVVVVVVVERNVVGCLLSAFN